MKEKQTEKQTEKKTFDLQVQGLLRKRWTKMKANQKKKMKPSEEDTKNWHLIQKEDENYFPHGRVLEGLRAILT